MKNVYQVNFTLDQLNAAITALDTRARQKMEILEECKKSKPYYPAECRRIENEIELLRQAADAMENHYNFVRVS